MRRTSIMVARWISILAIALLSAPPGTLAAAPPDSTSPRTLAEYIALARAASPSLRAAFADARAAAERVGVATGYPDPLLMYGYYAAPDPMQGRQELLLRQEIPFPGKRGLRGDVAARDADMRARASDALVLDTDFNVTAAFFEYVRASEVEQVLRDERALVVRMRDVSRVRYSAGTAQQQDVLKLELTISQIDDDLTMNVHEQDRVRARLNEMIGRDPQQALAAPVWTMPDARGVETIADPESALVHRPEVAAAQAGVARAEAARTLAGREYIPDFMLGVMFEFGAGEDQHWEVLAGVNIPIWLGKRRAMVRETDAMREAARYQLDAEELRVRRDLEDALHGVYGARERLERFETLILPQAEQSFLSSEVGYRAGHVDFMDYLDSQRMLLAMRREYYGVVAGLGIQIAALERAMGRGTADK